MLLGATGTGKSATTAWLVERLQRPTLVMAPNKTLAAQLANELRELLPAQRGGVLRLLLRLLPARGVHPADRHLHREGLLDQRGRRAAAALGDDDPAHPARRRRGGVGVLHLRPGHAAGVPGPVGARCRSARTVERDKLLRALVDIQYTRNDMAFNRGTFRVRGDTVEIIPAYEELAVRIELFGDEVEELYYLHPLTGDVVKAGRRAADLPGHALRRRAGADGAGDPGHRGRAGGAAGRAGAAGQAAGGAAAADAHPVRRGDDAPGRVLLRHRELLAAHRRPRARLGAGARLLDYFPDDFLLVIDESHVTVPQIGGMYEGDMSRKRTLVDHGFRLPSALDNRPLTFEEFTDRIGQTVYLSATPGPYELSRTGGEFVEQVIRPTGLVDPRGRGRSRPRARSTTWCTRSGCAPSATSGCWSPR